MNKEEMKAKKNELTELSTIERNKAKQTLTDFFKVYYSKIEYRLDSTYLEVRGLNSYIGEMKAISFEIELIKGDDKKASIRASVYKDEFDLHTGFLCGSISNVDYMLQREIYILLGKLWEDDKNIKNYLQTEFKNSCEELIAIEREITILYFAIEDMEIEEKKEARKKKKEY